MPTSLLLTVPRARGGRGLHRTGATSCLGLLGEAVWREVFALGRSEVGDAKRPRDSTLPAEPVAGGDRFYGPTSVGALTPVWTRRGLYGQVNPALAHPQGGATGRGGQQPSGSLPAATSVGQWGADGRARVKRGFV